MTALLPRRRLAFPAIAAGILCLGIAGPAVADRTFSGIASEILSGIEDTRTSLVPATSGYGAPTIAIKAFAKNGPPIPADVANAWNRRLLAELHRQSRGRFEFVDMASIGDLVRAIKASDSSDDDKSRRIADLKSNIRADILVSGNIMLAATTPVLSYQAWELPTAGCWPPRHRSGSPGRSRSPPSRCAWQPPDRPPRSLRSAAVTGPSSKKQNGG